MFDIIENVYVINLQEDLGRYSLCLFELSKTQKVNKTNFVKRSLTLKALLKTLQKIKLKKFDSCFRCDDTIYKNFCEHENNIITPMQVGNFLSFKSYDNEIRL